MARRWLNVFIFSWASLLSCEGQQDEAPATISSFSELSFDSNGHLDPHWLLIPSECAPQFDLHKTYPHFRVGLASDALSNELKLVECPSAAVFEKGTAKDLLSHGSKVFSGENFQEWMQEQMRVELGWISYHSNPIKVMWVSSDGHEEFQASLQYGERFTHWRTGYIGHRFRIYDETTGELLDEMEAQVNQMKVIGQPRPVDESERTRDRSQEMKRVDAFEMTRAKAVKRTFTERGFDKIEVPRPIWASIQTYYYNNRNNMVREEWDRKGIYVNWWKSDPFLVQPPMHLKTQWQDQLRPLVQEWIGGYELENTDIYGLRKYTDGAVLLKHVDRQETHAISMIINVDQSDDLEEPWLLEIHDHRTETPTFVDMKPGELVFYESARCMHGRPQPLKGSYYVNLFSHYRPVGNPKWYYEEKVTQVVDGKPVEVQSNATKSTRELVSERVRAQVQHTTASTKSLFKAGHRIASQLSVNSPSPFFDIMNIHLARQNPLILVGLALLAIFAMAFSCTLCISCCINIKKNRNLQAKSLKDGLPISSPKNMKGFGSWDAQQAVRESLGLEPRIRHDIISGRIAPVRKWVDDCASQDHERLNVYDSMERTALHLAAKAGHESIVRILCEKGADPNVMDKHHLTPLHLAASEGRGVCVKILIDHKANALMRNQEGKTPLDVARQSGNRGCEMLLKRAMERTKSSEVSDLIRDSV